MIYFKLASSFCQISGKVEPRAQSGGVRKPHNFEVYFGHSSSAIGVSSCSLLGSDIRDQTGSLTQG